MTGIAKDTTYNVFHFAGDCTSVLRRNGNVVYRHLARAGGRDWFAARCGLHTVCIYAYCASTYRTVATHNVLIRLLPCLPICTVLVDGIYWVRSNSRYWWY